MTEGEQRAAVVVAARAWLGTEYHHAARVKGAGVDCAQILAVSFSEAGVIADFFIPPYPPDWHMHRSEERYVQTIERFATEYDPKVFEPLPGDVVAWRYGRTFSHGAIVSQWPKVIHAFAAYGSVVETPVADFAGEREMRAFSVWPR
jgi:cell wall-associated NlpC family hydrolase